MLRGAVLSSVFAVDTHYPAAVSNGSPLFKLPVDAVQRGRDHGLPTYNDARLVSTPPPRVITCTYMRNYFVRPCLCLVQGRDGARVGVVKMKDVHGAKKEVSREIELMTSEKLACFGIDRVFWSVV